MTDMTPVADPNSAKPRTASQAAIGPVVLDEMRQCWGEGDPVLAESFLRRPAFAACDEAAIVDVIYAEQAVRREFGEVPVLADYLARFPAHASALRRQWEFDEIVEQSSDHPVAGRTEISPVAASIVDPPFACPGAFGRYILVAPLDSGGQAFVYRAVHPDLGLEVVLKIARAPVSPETPQGERILAEARTLAALSHPHLPRIFDAGIESGYPFLVLEYLRGRTLGDIVRHSPQSVVDALLLANRIAQAVAVAHARGVLHLDIKPKNIVIDDRGDPRLIDFGLARWQDPWSEDRSATGSLSGTLQFMAPEQAQGDSERIGEPSDVYALGAVLLFALTGQPPRTGSSFAEILEKARRGDWDHLALSRSNIPANVVRICELSLQVDPAERMQSAAEFAEAAAAAARALHRRPWWFALAGGLALATVMMAAYAISLAGWGDADTVPPANLPQNPDAPVAISDALRVEVWDVDRYLNLANVAPLKTGDRIRVRMQVPASTHAALFLVTSDGSVRQLSAVPALATAREVLFPPSDQQAVPLTGSPGTEFLFFCGDRDAPVSVDVVKAAWGEAGDWPALPQLSVLSMNRQSVTIEQAGRDIGAAVDQADPESAIVRRLEQFRRKLLTQCEVFEGWAFAHRKP